MARQATRTRAIPRARLTILLALPRVGESDTERIGPTGIAFDVGWEALPLVGEISRAVITGRPAVVRDVEHAPSFGSEVRRRGVRRVGIEEYRVARAGRHRLRAEAAHVVIGERRPLFADEPAGVVSGAQLEAAVLGCGGVDAEHGGDEQVGVCPPAGLLVLVRLEAAPARQLEVDLVLEEDGRLTEKPGDGAAELVALAQLGEPGVERAKVLDPLQHAVVRTQEARLEVLHGAPGHLGQTLQLVGPRRDPGDFPLVEEAPHYHEAVSLERLPLRGHLGSVRQSRLGPPGRLAQFCRASFHPRRATSPAFTPIPVRRTGYYRHRHMNESEPDVAGLGRKA